MAWRMPTCSSPRMSGTSSSACSIWSEKSSWVKGSSVGERAEAAMRGDLVGVHEDRPVGVRAHLQVAAVLALVHVGVHVADDREGDLADRVGEERHGPDADHLVHGRRERDRRAGHAGDARAPHAAGDDDRLGLDGAAIGVDTADAAVLHVQAGDLDAGGDGQRAQGLRPLAHDRAGPQRVHDQHAGGIEGAEDDARVKVGHEALGLGRRDQLGVDAPRVGRGEPPLQLLHARGRARHLQAAALGGHAHLHVLAGAVDGEGRHLLGVVGEVDEVRGVTGRAAGVGQGALVEQHDVPPAQSRQVVGHAVADDARADDHHVGAIRYRHE